MLIRDWKGESKVFIVCVVVLWPLCCGYSNKTLWPIHSGHLPRASEMTSLEDKGMRCLLTFGGARFPAVHRRSRPKKRAKRKKPNSLRVKSNRTWPPIATLLHFGRGLSKTALVDQLPHGLQGGIAVCDIRLHQLQHVQDGLVHLPAGGLAKEDLK